MVDPILMALRFRYLSCILALHQGTRRLGYAILAAAVSNIGYRCRFTRDWPDGTYHARSSQKKISMHQDTVPDRILDSDVRS